MKMLPVFIKVHDLADDTIVYRINSNSIDYATINIAKAYKAL